MYIKFIYSIVSSEQKVGKLSGILCSVTLVTTNYFQIFTVRDPFRILLNIYDGCFCEKYWLLSVNDFRKIRHVRQGSKYASAQCSNFLIRDHYFSTYAKVSGKLTSLTPHTHMYVCAYQG